MKESCFKSLFCAKAGFTLIELLVVVLIIGILAAVALPQYQKAVEKSRIATALTVIESIKKSMDVWRLENGNPKTMDYFLWPDSFVENDDERKAESTVEVRNGLDCSGEACTDGTFVYYASCSNSDCGLSIYRGWEAVNEESGYNLQVVRKVSSNKWEHRCLYFDASGERACNTLQGQGNWTIEAN